jgi:PAS domain S-box-containing protein
MTRLVHELGRKEFGLRARITSLDPVYPGNKPDPWETSALTRFASGPSAPKEIAEVSAINGENHLRFMAPLVTREQCLKCHAAQGYKVGDIRGGLSVSISLERSYFPGAVGARQAWHVTLAGIWALGLVGLGGVGMITKQRRREREEALSRLRDSEERLRLALTSGGMGAWDWDLESNCGRWTEEHERLFGLQAGTFDGRFETMKQCVHPEDREGVELVLERARTQGARCDHVFRIQWPDGSTHWMHAQGECKRDDGGSPTRFTGVVREITHERAIRERLEFQALVLDQITDTVAVTGLDGRITYVNSALCGLQGSDPEAMLGQHIESLRQDESATPTQSEVLETTLAQGTWRGEIALAATGGQHRLIDLRTQVIHSQSGDPVAVCGIGTDITARKAAEQAVRERERLYRAVVESSVDGFWVVDIEGRLLEVNEAYVARSGYSRQELLGMKVWDLEAVETQPATERHMERIRRTGHELFETKHRAKDGTPWQVEVNAAWWSVGSGRIFAFLRDINKRKTSESLLLTRLRLSDIADRGTLDDLMQASLDACEMLTGSTIGFFHFVDPDQKNLTLQTWSSNTLRHMCKADGKGAHYAIQQAGVWVDCFHTRAPVIHNDYNRLPHRKGMPEGHATVTRELVVPILRDGLVIAILGVGNKTTDYGPDDVQLTQELASIAMDLVNRKRAEELLRAEEAKFRSYVMHAPVGVLVTDPEGNYLEVNPASEQMLGYAAGTLRGKSVREITAPEDALVGAEHFARVVSEGFSDGVVRLRHRDGHNVPVSIRAVRLSEDRFMGIMVDLSERFRAESALRESEARYRRLFNNATEGIAIADADTGELIDVNDAFTQLMKRSRDELVGTPQRDLHPKSEIRGQYSETFDRHRGEGHDEILRAPILTGTGEIREVEIKAQVMQLGPRRVVQGFFRDATERLKAERERERLNGELDRKNQELQNVLFAASHDLRAPLLNVQGHTRRLEQACDKLIPLLEPTAREGALFAQQALAILKQDVPKSAAFVRSGAEKMDLLISGMLRLSRLGQVAMVWQPLAMDRILQLALSSHALQLEESGATVRTNPLPDTVGDPTLIGQVFSNLIDNAIKYRSRERSLTLDITGWKESDRCVYCVEDNGIGIPAHKAAKIWELFGRLTPDLAGGEGLGLNLVKRIVDRHGGEIHMQPSPSGGCRFLFSIAAAPRSRTASL